MARFCSVFVLVVLLCTTATNFSHAQDFAATGLSAFGIQSNQFQGINCKRLLRIVNQAPTPAIAILYKTFGTNNRCLRQFWTIAKRRNTPHLTEIHFSNEVGRRNEVHDIHDFLPFTPIKKYNEMLEEMSPQLEQKIRLRVREILEMIEPYKNSGTFILTTGLEDRYSLTAWQNIYEVLKSEWPYEIARSSIPHNMLKQYDSMPAEIYMEYHGYRSKFSQPQRCIANGDGQDVSFLENTGVEFEHAKPATLKTVKTWLSRAIEKDCITFLWTSKWQGIYGDAKLTQPLKRTFKIDASDMTPIKTLLRNTVLERQKRFNQSVALQ